MYKKFTDLPKIAQILLLLIPFVNFITELIIRVDLYDHKKTTGNLVLFIIGLLSAGLLGFIDAILVLVKGEILTIND